MEERLKFLYWDEDYSDENLPSIQNEETFSDSTEDED